MRCAVRSRSWWRKSWTSTECWSLGPCPGPSEGPLHPPEPGSSQSLPLPCPLQALMRVRLVFAIPNMALLSLFPLWPYPFLCPLAPRKGSWLADKVKRLMRPRREGGPHGGPRLGADGAGSTESLGGPPETELSEGREADGTGGSGGRVTRLVPTPCLLSPPWCLPAPLVSPFILCTPAGLPCHVPLSWHLPPAGAATHPVLPIHSGV